MSTVGRETGEMEEEEGIYRAIERLQRDVLDKNCPSGGESLRRGEKGGQQVSRLRFRIGGREKSVAMRRCKSMEPLWEEPPRQKGQKGQN